MGFFDEILADVREITGEIQGLKNELVSSVLDPSGELRDKVNEIASELTGKGPVSPPENVSKDSNLPK